MITAGLFQSEDLLVRQGADDVGRSSPALKQRHSDRDDIAEPPRRWMLSVKFAAELQDRDPCRERLWFDENGDP
ncbi:MAG: hypothetical protein ACRDQ5_25305 [Sciscionella sp.]